MTIIEKSLPHRSVRYLEDVADDWHRSVFDILSNDDGELAIAIPEDLGGGVVLEEEYELTNRQVLVLDELLMTRRVKAEISTIEGIVEGRPVLVRSLSEESQSEFDKLKELFERPKFDQDGIAAVSPVVTGWEIMEVLRILRPLSDNMNTALRMGRNLTDHQVDFLARYDKYTEVAARCIKLGEGSDAQEKLIHVFDELAELEYRRQNGMLYNDGSPEDPYLKKKLEERLLTTEAGHGDEYFETKLGRTVLAIIEGTVRPEQLVEQEDAIAVLDALHFGTGISEFLEPDYVKSLRYKARKILGLVSYYVAVEARAPRGPVAHPRLSTGDGVPTLTRPEPGV